MITNEKTTTNQRTLSFSNKVPIKIVRLIQEKIAIALK